MKTERRCITHCRVPQVSLVLRDLGAATSAASVMGIAFFLPHFGSPVVDVVLAQVSQLRRDLGHPAIDLVLASPRRWPASDLDTRKFVLRRFPYAVIYHERKSVVRILAIAHGRRQPGYWKNRV